MPYDYRFTHYFAKQRRPPDFLLFLAYLMAFGVVVGLICAGVYIGMSL